MQIYPPESKCLINVKKVSIRWSIVIPVIANMYTLSEWCISVDSQHICNRREAEMVLKRAGEQICWVLICEAPWTVYTGCCFNSNSLWLLLSRVVAIFLKPMFDFYKQMTDTKYHMVTDVYALMFLCDVITFIIVVFGYSSFGPAVSVTQWKTCTLLFKSGIYRTFYITLHN